MEMGDPIHQSHPAEERVGARADRLDLVCPPPDDGDMVGFVDPGDDGARPLQRYDIIHSQATCSALRPSLQRQKQLSPRVVPKDALRRLSSSSDGASPLRRSHAWDGDFADVREREGKQRRKSLFAGTFSHRLSFDLRAGSSRAATIDKLPADGEGQSRFPSKERRSKSVMDNFGEGLAMFASMASWDQEPEGPEEGEARRALRAEFDKYDKDKTGRLTERQMSHLLFSRLYVARRLEAGRRRSINPIGAAVSTSKAFDLSTKLYLADAQASSLVMQNEFRKHNLHSMSFEDFVLWNKRQEKNRLRKRRQSFECEGSPPPTGASPSIQATPTPTSSISSSSSSVFSRGFSLLTGRNTLPRKGTAASLAEERTAPMLDVHEGRSYSFPVRVGAQKPGMMSRIFQFGNKYNK